MNQIAARAVIRQLHSACVFLNSFQTLYNTLYNVGRTVYGNRYKSYSTEILAPYKRPPKISTHGRTKDWAAFRKTPVLLISGKSVSHRLRLSQLYGRGVNWFNNKVYDQKKGHLNTFMFIYCKLKQGVRACCPINICLTWINQCLLFVFWVKSCVVENRIAIVDCVLSRRNVCGSFLSGLPPKK